MVSKSVDQVSLFEQCNFVLLPMEEGGIIYSYIYLKTKKAEDVGGGVDNNTEGHSDSMFFYGSVVAALNDGWCITTS